MPVTFIAVSTALAVWRQARIGAERAAALADALADALESSLRAEAAEAGLRADIAELRGRADRLTLKQARIERHGTAGGYQDAIRLSQDGADDHVLMDTCGLTRGEAQLIRNLYQPDGVAQAH
jgi:hypothetical protein